MDGYRAQRIRDGLDRAYGAFWFTLGIAGALILTALVVVGLVASVAWMAGRV